MSNANGALITMVNANQDRAEWALRTGRWQNNLVGILHAVAQLASDPSTDREILTHEAKEALRLCQEYIEQSPRPVK